MLLLLSVFCLCGVVCEGVSASASVSARESVSASVSVSARESVSVSAWAWVRASVSAWVRASVSAWVWVSAWVCVIDYDLNYFLNIFKYIKYSDLEYSDLEYLKLILKAKEYGICYWFELINKPDTLYLIPAPIILYDNQNRFHSTTGPAIYWKGGEEIYMIHGVKFDNKKDWENHKAMSVKEILKLENIDVRAALMIDKGPDAIFEAVDTTLIDSCKVMREHGILEYELYEVRGLTEEVEKMLRYKCASFERTGKWYVKFVNPSYTKALNAIAFAHNLTPKEYLSINKQG